LLNAEASNWRNKVIENAIADASYSLEGKGPQGIWQSMQHKCNAYVYDVLKKAGLAPSLAVAANGRRIPQAGEWANESVVINASYNGKVVGQWVVTKTPYIGDVVALALPDGASSGIPYSGHAGILHSRINDPIAGTIDRIMAAHENGAYISATDQLGNPFNKLIYRTYKPN
jgi:hypothetical protein